MDIKGYTILIDENGTTIPQEFSTDLEYSKFELLSLISSIHLGYNLSEDWEIGMGGFAGIKLSSSQKYEYDLNGKFLESQQTQKFQHQ